jgi:hypothetical protein
MSEHRFNPNATPELQLQTALASALTAVHQLENFFHDRDARDQRDGVIRDPFADDLAVNAWTLVSRAATLLTAELGLDDRVEPMYIAPVLPVVPILVERTPTYDDVKTYQQEIERIERRALRTQSKHMNP